MLKKLFALASLLFLFGHLPTARAAEPAQMTAEEFVNSLKFQSGNIELPNGIASLNLPASFRYLGPDDANRVLVDAWGNPPGTKTLGMIFPSDVSPVERNAWGVVITYDEDGHVNDEDADSINYNDLLKNMQESTSAASEERLKNGYSSMSLVGWAEPPHYDKASHKLYWAQELAVGNNAENTLNYNIRVLGRKGVLVLNAVSGMSQLPMVKAEMPGVLAATNFKAGNSYADFDSSTDKVAAYGIAALIAGGAAAKLGLFAKLFALLIAFKKAILLGAIALVAAIRKLLGLKKKEAPELG